MSINKHSTIFIGDRPIGLQHPPFIIAELSGNHNQQLSLALDMVEAAAKAGAHAIKLQTFTADSMTLDVNTADFVIQEKDSLWHGASLHGLYAKAATPYEWHSVLFNRAKELGMLAFSSPFDANAVDFLGDLEVPCYKIASFELTDIPLISKTASMGKPIIMSTGMAALSEIEAAVVAAKAAGCDDIILLKCTSTYPASPINSNLKTIEHMQKLFDVEVGLSDHTLGIGVAIASIAMGAKVIEKHFTLSRKLPGIDQNASIEPKELLELVKVTSEAKESLGNPIKKKSKEENDTSKSLRRSLVAAINLKSKTKLNRSMIAIKRPGTGIPTSFIKKIVGLRLKKNVKKDELFKLTDLGR